MELRVTNIRDGMVTGTSKPLDNLENIVVKHDETNGKNLVEVWVDEEIVFKYDSNCTQETHIINHIQISANREESQ